MAAVIFKLVTMILLLTIIIGFSLYCIFSGLSLWNECLHIDSQSFIFSSTSFAVNKIQRLHQYAQYILTQKSEETGRWNGDIESICEKTVPSKLYFILTSQFPYDSTLLLLFVKEFFQSIYKQSLELLQDCYDRLSLQFDIHSHELLLTLACLFISIVGLHTLVRLYHNVRNYYCDKSQPTLKVQNRHFFDSSADMRKDDTYTETKIDRYAQPIKQCSKNPSYRQPTSISHSVLCLLRWIILLISAAIFLSIPWEFIRLYQKAVAKRASSINRGLPQACFPNTASWLDRLFSFFRWQFSWSHDYDPCMDYYYATFVDPVWEVNPLIVLSSVLSHGFIHPFEFASASFGRSIRHFFAEIPSHWQPIILVLVAASLALILLILGSYRLAIPLLLRIEPRTPVIVRTNEKLQRNSESIGAKLKSYHAVQRNDSPDRQNLKDSVVLLNYVSDTSSDIDSGFHEQMKSDDNSDSKKVYNSREFSSPVSRNGLNRSNGINSSMKRRKVHNSNRKKQ